MNAVRIDNELTLYAAWAKHRFHCKIPVDWNVLFVFMVWGFLRTSPTGLKVDYRDQDGVQVLAVDPLVSASQILGLQACSATSGPL